MSNPLIQTAQMVFFEAMLRGYAKGGTGGRVVEKSTIVELPGSKVIVTDLMGWRAVDCYFTNPNSDKSAGQTTIWYQDIPVWTMCYGGSYPKVVIPFLKKCLGQAYGEEQFYGGRGPEFMEEEPFTYVNRFHGTFTSFKGEERIYDKSGARFGHHWYHGMSLLKS